MNRRGFLASMLGVAGGLVLPDREVRRVYSFPSEATIWKPRALGPTTVIVSPRILVASPATRDRPMEVRHATEFLRLFGYPPPPGTFSKPMIVPLTFGFRAIGIGKEG